MCCSSSRSALQNWDKTATLLPLRLFLFILPDLIQLGRARKYNGGVSEGWAKKPNTFYSLSHNGCAGGVKPCHTHTHIEIEYISWGWRITNARVSDETKATRKIYQNTTPNQTKMNRMLIVEA